MHLICYLIWLIAQIVTGATNNSSNVTYSADTKITEDASLSDKNYSSSKEDNNAVLTTGDIDVSLKDISVSKIGIHLLGIILVFTK